MDGAGDVRLKDVKKQKASEPELFFMRISFNFSNFIIGFQFWI